jgi:divalent metal cation (Fe/Co/Zn/Cd) transporter
MLSEAIHTLVDVGNQASPDVGPGLVAPGTTRQQGLAPHWQAILGFGLREAERSPDTSYQYGYGRAAFFYSLLTALSTFGFGSVYTFYQGCSALLAPQELHACPETWAVLGAISCLPFFGKRGRRG